MYQQLQNKVYTVSLLNKEIRYLLEKNFSALKLTGEISNFIAASSGHWYFTLKDDNAQIKAAMWRGNNRNAQFRPKDGDQVSVMARVSLYEPRGDYQLIVEHMEPAGEGLLKQAFEALKMRLAAEGLFSTAHKKPIPANIKKIAVITSPTGAAVRDVLKVLKQRAPQLEVVIYPAQVQGAEAHLQLIKQIELANKRRDVDVILLTRGGGSLEDLWCFNHEALARTIFSSALPIVSAVGHEIDTTISDYVADLRAATPSHAAELISPDINHTRNQIGELTARLKQAIEKQLRHKQHHVAIVNHQLALYHPNAVLMQQTQKLDELTLRLNAAISRRLHLAASSQTQLANRLQRLSPEQMIAKAQYQHETLVSRLSKAITQQLAHKQQALTLNAAKLEATSPLKVLARGYSITSHNQAVLTSSDQVNVGDKLTTQLANGTLISQVISRD